MRSTGIKTTLTAHCNWLATIGDGLEQLYTDTIYKDLIEVSPNHVRCSVDVFQVPAHMNTKNLGELIRFVFPDLDDVQCVSRSAVLTPLNKTVETINDMVLDMMPSDDIILLSADRLREGS